MNNIFLRFSCFKNRLLWWPYILAASYLISGCAHSPGVKENTFYLPNAEFEHPGHLDKLAVAMEKSSEPYELLQRYPTLDAHHLKQGQGAIFAYRKYEDSDPNWEDDEHYVKLSVWLNTLPGSGETKINLGDAGEVQAHALKGSSTWIAAMCSGKLGKGIFTILKQDKNYRVTVDAQFVPVPIKDDNCKEEHFVFSFEAEEIDFNQLTPWLGLRGGSEFEETSPTTHSGSE